MPGQYVDMQALSISASPFPGGAAQINSGGSSIYSKVSVNAGNNIYRGYALGDDNYEAADLRLEANNSVAQQVKASGISVGTAFATGTNLAATLVDLTTEAIAAGSKSGSHINDLAVSAKKFMPILTARPTVMAVRWLISVLMPLRWKMSIVPIQMPE